MLLASYYEESVLKKNEIICLFCRGFKSSVLVPPQRYKGIHYLASNLQMFSGFSDGMQSGNRKK